MTSITERFQQIIDKRKRLIKNKEPASRVQHTKTLPNEGKSKATGKVSPLKKIPKKSLDSRLGKRVEERLGKTVIERLGAPIPKGSIVVGGHVLGPKVKGNRNNKNK